MKTAGPTYRDKEETPRPEDARRCCLQGPWSPDLNCVETRREEVEVLVPVNGVDTVQQNGQVILIAREAQDKG